MEIWNFIRKHLDDNERVVLIIVIDTKGSSPGRPGFKMAVAEHGDISGSVGGGVMEYNMVERARHLLNNNTKEISVIHQVHDPEAEHDRSGMICSGEQTHAFIPVSPREKSTIGSITECIESGGRAIIEVCPSGLSFSTGEKTGKNRGLRHSNQAEWKYTEEVGFQETVYIFGAGHISLPLSRIMRMLDFRVVVYDDRKELSTFISNEAANNKEVIDYRKSGSLIPEDPGSYVVIMSFAHRSDDIILRQMLSKELKYLGMIGSRSKVNVIFDQLRREGYAEERIMAIKTPIGLPIGSQTPAEIAVSIAAEIVGVRRKRV